MIYLIFVNPDVVRKYAEYEVWFYHPNHDRFQVEFVFDRLEKQNLLRRNDELLLPWSAEIMRWNKGAIN